LSIWNNVWHSCYCVYLIENRLTYRREVIEGRFDDDLVYGYERQLAQFKIEEVGDSLNVLYILETYVLLISRNFSTTCV